MKSRTNMKRIVFCEQIKATINGEITRNVQKMSQHFQSHHENKLNQIKQQLNNEKNKSTILQGRLTLEETNNLKLEKIQNDLQNQNSSSRRKSWNWKKKSTHWKH